MASYVEEDKLIMSSSLIKRLIKLPFIIPEKVSMIYSNIQSLMIYLSYVILKLWKVTK